MPHFLLLLLLLLLAPASADVLADTPSLTSLASLAELDAFRAEHEGFGLVVYAPWCGHSRALLPEVERAAKSSGLVFAKADGTVADDVAKQLDIVGYPTLLFMRRGSGPPIPFEGKRVADAIVTWAKSKLSPQVATLAGVSDVATWIKDKAVALVLFVADPQAAPEVEALKGVAASGDRSLSCGVTAADPASSALGLLSLGTLAPPVLVAFTNSDDGPSALRASEGTPLTHESMLKFGRLAALPAVVAYEAGKVEQDLFAANVPLHLLYFHAAAIDDSARAVLAEVGKALRGEAAVATIDTRKHAEVTTFFDVTSTAGGGSFTPPMLMAFSLSNGTKFVHTAELTLAAVLDFARGVAAGKVEAHLRSQPAEEPAGPLVELVGSTFASVVRDPAKDVLIQFYSKSCGHCTKLRPVYEQVAQSFAEVDDVVIAQMDAVANDAPGLEPEGFPMIVLYAKANKNGLVYDGSRDAHDLIQFVNDARAGKRHIGGLPDGSDGMPDEDDGYRVEL